MASEEFFPRLTRQARHTFNASFIMAMTMCIFGKSLKISWLNLGGLLAVILFTYFLGGNKKVQNNYTVHLLVMSFTPVMIALHVKYDIFSAFQSD